MINSAANEDVKKINSERSCVCWLQGTAVTRSNSALVSTHVGSRGMCQHTNVYYIRLQLITD
jgi:hypothetical protein